MRDAPGHVGITLANHFLHVQHVRTTSAQSVGNKSFEEFWEISRRTTAVIAGFGKPGKHRCNLKESKPRILSLALKISLN